jgi:hypothetical protein
MSEVTETLALRLTDAQVAAIMRRIERRKKHVGECALIDLGDISSAVHSNPSQACKEAEQKLMGAA